MRSLLGSAFILIFAFGCGKRANVPAPGEQGSEALGSTPNGVPAPSAPTGNRYANDFGMEFARVPKGTLSTWKGKQDIPNDFYIGVYEVTQEEWRAVTGAEPKCYFSPGGRGSAKVQGLPPDELKRFPADSISWKDAQNFVTQLNTKHKLNGWKYRLPTVHEWAYAAYGPQENVFAFKSGPTDTLTTKQANIGSLPGSFKPQLAGCLGRTCRVGSYEPNIHGLYDVYGNVHEWCDDPAPTERWGHCVSRGGSFTSDVSECRGSGLSGESGAAVHGLRVVLAPVAAVAPPPAAKTEPAPTAQKEPQVSKLTATSFMNLLKADAQAGNRYKQKWFQIEGTVAGVDEGHNIVTLTGTKVANVQCFFFGTAQADVGRCKVGQKVVVKGIFTGTSADGHAQLLKCEVVK